MFNNAIAAYENDLRIDNQLQTKISNMFSKHSGVFI